MAVRPVVGWGALLALLALSTYSIITITYNYNTDQVKLITYNGPIIDRSGRSGELQGVRGVNEGHKKGLVPSAALHGLTSGGSTHHGSGRYPRNVRQLTDQEKQLIVSTHNTIRGEVGSSNMQQMVWSSDLEVLSAKAIELCQLPNKASPTSSCTTENLSSTKDAQRSVLDIIQEWHEERLHYDYGSNACINGAECNHYKRLVRHDFGQVGCAITVCPGLTVEGPSSDGLLVLSCHYKPRPIPHTPGDVPYQQREIQYTDRDIPYTEGPACTACPPHLQACRGGLCAEPVELEELNAYRRQQGASSMARLFWNQTLAALAAVIAGSCPPPEAPPGNGVVVVGRLPLQEEVPVTAAHLRGALRAVGAHLEEYDYLSDTCGTPSCRQALPIVWDTLTSVGCDHALCPIDTPEGHSGDQQVLVLVCLFTPSGVDVTSRRPYVKGPVCSMCPPGARRCHDGLCVGGPLVGCPDIPAPARLFSNDVQGTDTDTPEDGEAGSGNETSAETMEEAEVNQTMLTTTEDGNSTELFNGTTEGIDSSTTVTTEEPTTTREVETTTTAISGSIMETDIVLVITIDGMGQNRRKRETADMVQEVAILSALRQNLAVSVNRWCAASPGDCCRLGMAGTSSPVSAARFPLVDPSRILVLGGTSFSQNASRLYHASARPLPDNPLCALSDPRADNAESAPLPPGVLLAAVLVDQMELTASLTSCCQARLHRVYRRDVTTTSVVTSEPDRLYGLALWVWVIVIVVVLMTLIFILTGLVLRYKKDTILSDTSSLQRFMDSPELHRRRHRRRHHQRRRQYRPHTLEHRVFKLPPRPAPHTYDPYLFRGARRNHAPTGPLPHYIGAGVRSEPYEEIRSGRVTAGPPPGPWGASDQRSSTWTSNPGLWPRQGIPVLPPRRQYENHPQRGGNLQNPPRLLGGLYQNGQGLGRLYGNAYRNVNVNGGRAPSNTSSNTIEHFFFERGSQS